LPSTRPIWYTRARVKHFTSTAKGHTLIKVRQDGTIEFKTQINNKNHEKFIAATFTRLHRRRRSDPRAAVRRAGSADERPPHQTERRAETGRRPDRRRPLRNPSGYDVNYRLTAFPGGAIRRLLH
jgi:hypothetical protein